MGINRSILIIIITFLAIPGYSQVSYHLNVYNDVTLSNNEIQFDIYFSNTGSNPIEYAVGQYIINYSDSIVNGGNLSLSLLNGTSELLSYQVPQPGKLKVSGDQIQIFGMPPFGNDSALVIPAGDSIRIGTFSLHNTNSFNQVPWGFKWKNEGTFRTKIFAYLSEANTNITDTSRHKLQITHNTSSISQISEIALDYELQQNYPNPFNPSTTIEFNIPVKDMVTLEVYNSLGEKIAALVNEQLLPGTYSYEFNGENLSSGVYFYKLQSGEYSKTRRMILIK